MIEIKPKHTYARDAFTGALYEDPAPGRVDAVVCRRVEDYPDAIVPAGAALAWCARCRTLIAYDPTGPHGLRPRYCFQCWGIVPEPFIPPTR